MCFTSQRRLNSCSRPGLSTNQPHRSYMNEPVQFSLSRRLENGIINIKDLFAGTGGKMSRWHTLVVSMALFVSPIVLAQSGKTNEAAASPGGDRSIRIHHEIDFSA